jgi:dTDP-4-dehydrorhamnose reductase
MKIGVIGYTGMVGSVLVERGYKPIKVDITKLEEVKDYFRKNKLDCVVYAAGFTDVDKCEEEMDKAFAVNVLGVNHVLQSYRGNFVYISSDHVFDGKRNWFNRGYSEKHDPNPLNTYGRTKLGGEFITSTLIEFMTHKPLGKVIRTSKLFNKKYVLDKLQKKEVSDVLRRTFLHVNHFCVGLAYFIEHWDDMPELLHISGADNLTHYQFLFHCADKLGLPSPDPRKHQLRDATSRPIRGGLNVSLAKSLGVPVYSAYEGVKLL